MATPRHYSPSPESPRSSSPRSSSLAVPNDHHRSTTSTLVPNTQSNSRPRPVVNGMGGGGQGGGADWQYQQQRRESYASPQRMNGLNGVGGGYVGRGGGRGERSSSPIRKRADARRRSRWARLRRPLMVFGAFAAILLVLLMVQPDIADWLPFGSSISSEDEPVARVRGREDASAEGAGGGGAVAPSTPPKKKTKSFTPSTYYPKSRRATTPSPFFPSLDPLPVHHLESQMIYHNYPFSPHRPPSNQFTLSPDAKFHSPVIALITATNNPRKVMLETAASLQSQSLQNWIWIIVDDHTTSPESYQLIKNIAKDPRVTVIKNEGKKGLAQGRNVALRHLFGLENCPQYLASLDDDDLYEFTALEKVVWLLESNKEWDLGGFPYVKWGSANETVWTGLHSGFANLQWGNFVPNAAVYRTSAVLKSGCRYDEERFSEGGEDWDFWMCLASAGSWGGTVPEILYWYRQNPSAFRATRWGATFINGFNTLKQKIHSKYETLLLPGAFPQKMPRHSRQLENITWTAPFDPLLAHHPKTIMFVVPWLYVGGADIGLLHMVQLYAEAGYRVTVLCTLYKEPAGIELRPEVLKWTHDVHIMPSFLRANDFPRYFKYLVESRGIEEVVMSNSQLTYEMLPALVEQMPQVKFVDYLHNEAYDGWKSGGYPVYSIISQRYLARTLTCSSYLRDWLIERGHSEPDRIGVVKLGIEIADFRPVSDEHRTLAKAAVLGLEADTVVIAFVGRLDNQKRPLLIPKIVNEILQSGGEATPDFQVIMLGDGPLLENLRDEIETDELSDFIREYGTVAKPQEYLAAADIFLLPSMSEGISIAVAEAMAMGLPIVTAKAGALPEQLGEGTESVAGILIDHTLEDDDDAKLYADALMKLLDDAKARKQFGMNARKNVEGSFDWRDTLRGLFSEVAIAENPESHPGAGGFGGKKKRGKYVPPKTPHPAAYLAVQMVLADARPESDFAVGYQRLKTSI